jgi:2-dehydropantoate 2-reductase
MASPSKGSLTPILVVGTGALATLFAARLSAAGHPVSMLGSWTNGIHALAREGARLVDADGRVQAYPVHATTDPAEVRGARAALVLVKAWQTAEAARKLADCLAPDGLAVTLQNGYGNRERLAESLGASRVALGSSTTGATLLGPGLARPGGEGVVTLERRPGMSPIAAALRSASFDVHMSANVRSLLWGKLVINAAINPLTALLRVTNGELLNRPSARRLMGELAEEAAAVARAEKVLLPFENPLRAAEQVARRTAANHSSMYQDIQRGTPTEIDAICGAVTRQGASHGVPTPMNRACWELVKALAAAR